MRRKTMSNELVPVIGYEGLYSVTQNGDVWAHPKKSRSKGRWLKKTINNCGYLYVCLYDGLSKNKYVHRIVAEAWLPNNGKPHINHKNGLKTDNRLNNLEWVTPSENKKHAFNTGLTSIKISQRLASSRNITINNIDKRLLSIEQARQVRMMFLDGHTRNDLSKHFEIDYGVIKRIVSNKSYMEAV